MKNTTGFLVALEVAVLLLSSSAALAQQCEILKAMGGSAYVVKIGGDVLYTVSEEVMKKSLDAKRQLSEVEQKRALDLGLIAHYDKIKDQYETTLRQQKEYIAELEAVLNGYKDLVAKYRKLKEPWLTFEGGIGYTGDTDPAVMLGLGIKQIRIWGFLQEGNGGVLAGVSLPLF